MRSHVSWQLNWGKLPRLKTWVAAHPPPRTSPLLPRLYQTLIPSIDWKTGWTSIAAFLENPKKKTHTLRFPVWVLQSNVSLSLRLGQRQPLATAKHCMTLHPTDRGASFLFAHRAAGSIVFHRLYRLLLCIRSKDALSRCCGDVGKWILDFKGVGSMHNEHIPCHRLVSIPLPFPIWDNMLYLSKKKNILSVACVCVYINIYMVCYIWCSSFQKNITCKQEKHIAVFFLCILYLQKALNKNG